VIASVGVSKYDVGKVWSKVEPFLLNALMKWLPVWGTDDIYIELMNDRMQLWIAFDEGKEDLLGAVITQVMVFPKGKILNVMLLGGNNIKIWKESMYNAVRDFAKSEQCYALQAMGRKGWTPLFPNMFESAVIINEILDY